MVMMWQLCCVKLAAVHLHFCGSLKYLHCVGVIACATARVLALTNNKVHPCASFASARMVLCTMESCAAPDPVGYSVLERASKRGGGVHVPGGGTWPLAVHYTYLPQVQISKHYSRRASLWCVGINQSRDSDAAPTHTSMRMWQE